MTTALFDFVITLPCISENLFMPQPQDKRALTYVSRGELISILLIWYRSRVILHFIFHELFSDAQTGVIVLSTGQ